MKMHMENCQCVQSAGRDRFCLQTKIYNSYSLYITRFGHVYICLCVVSTQRHMQTESERQKRPSHHANTYAREHIQNAIQVNTSLQQIYLHI